MIVWNETKDQVLIPECSLMESAGQKLRGYQFATTLSPTEGLFFQWKEPAIRNMHMRNVPFALLMIWLDDSNRVGWYYVAQPSHTRLYSSTFPASACLECHPSKYQEIQLGDILLLK